MKSFIRMSEGFPVEWQDNFWRMLYLSTVTVTSLGYGDNIPVTTTARLMVSPEAVAGLIVMGLFLNFVVEFGQEDPAETTVHLPRNRDLSSQFVLH